MPRDLRVLALLAGAKLDVSSRAAQEHLVEKGYIVSPMKDPGAGEDSYSHYVRDADGKIICSNHGPVPEA